MVVEKLQPHSVCHEPQTKPFWMWITALDNEPAKCQIVGGSGGGDILFIKVLLFFLQTFLRIVRLFISIHLLLPCNRLPIRWASWQKVCSIAEDQKKKFNNKNQFSSWNIAIMWFRIVIAMNNKYNNNNLHVQHYEGLVNCLHHSILLQIQLRSYSN